MYDTIEMYLTQDAAPSVDFLAEVPCRLSRIHSQGETQYGEFVNGDLNGLKIKVNEKRVSIKGSLCKYFHGDNFSRIARAGTQQAIEMLSDTLLLPFAKAVPTRIDVAANLLLRYPPEAYFPYLGVKPRYRRLEQDAGLYYKTQQKTLVLYDKIIEQKRKGNFIPILYQGRNLLRVEFRWMSSLRKHLKVPELTASMLYDRDIYCMLLDHWKNEYFVIKKNRIMELNQDRIQDAKDFEKMLLQFGVQELGGQEEVLKMIDRAKAKGGFKNRMQPARLKAKVYQICSLPEGVEEGGLAGELDEKIKQAVKFYR